MLSATTEEGPSCLIMKLLIPAPLDNPYVASELVTDAAGSLAYLGSLPCCLCVTVRKHPAL